MLTLVLGLTAVASGAPTLSIVFGPNGPTRDTTPEFRFEVSDAIAVECSIDQGAADYGPCSDSDEHTNGAPLADGDYTFRVRAVDVAEAETVATRDFTVDTAEPSVSIGSGPSGPISDDTPTFGFSGEAGATLECSVDHGSPAYGPCSGAGEHTPPTLADGSYTFRVRATDTAGNVSPVATRTFRVDTLRPDTTIDSQPLGTTDDQSPALEFSASEAGVDFECRLDSEAFAPCTSPKAYAALPAGTHQFHVRATDDAGNVEDEPATEEFTIDLLNPTLAIVSGPSGATNDATPTFGFDAEAGTTVECSIDQGTADYGPCGGGATHAAGPLADGTYTFRVRATDAVPHETIETRAFTVDTVAPTTTIGGGPSGPTNDASPSFTFGSNEGGVDFECRRDSEAFAPCTSPKAYAGLPDGAHSFRVRAKDAAGNVDVTEDAGNLRGFTVDTVAPTASITFGPTGTTSDDSPLFEFTVGGDPSTVQCSIDQDTPSFGACSSAGSHVVTTRLAAGDYSFRVRATDLAGNATTATRAFAVAGAGPGDGGGGTTTPPPTPTTSTNPPVATPPIVPTVPGVAPLPRLMSPFPLVRLSGRVTRLGVKVEILSVRAPRGAQVRVRVKQSCPKGARCPVKLGSGKIASKGSLRFKTLELSYRAGTAIEVRVSEAGAIGKYTRFVIRRGKGPQRVDRCLMPGVTQASACPTA